MDKIAAIDEFLNHRYTLQEYPALAHQFRQWFAERPLENISVLDGTPVFANTLLKYKNLLAAGAKLCVGYSETIPFDPRIIDFLNSIGVETIYNCTSKGKFDLILDCNAVYRDLQPRYGFTELTRSGAFHFANTDCAVINVDDSRIKAIETCLGTGEGFLRAMEKLDFEVAGRKIVVFGCGKVGRGVVFYAGRAGAEVFAVDDPDRVKKCVNGTLIDRFDRPKVLQALREAWCVVSSTGQADALADAEYINIVRDSDQIMVNMGVEDEWGKLIPECRMLNNKQPLNFILEEPTLLRYIEATMAIHSHGALMLLKEKYPAGLHKIDPLIHDSYWQITEQYGLIANELHAAGL